MKHVFFLASCIFCLFFSSVNGQNKVGIGTPTPTEMLDVNGNVNVSGQIKLNGDAGQVGQVMTVGSDGNPSWAIAQQFTKMARVFTANGFMNIPANVDRVMIEVWSGGGGGALGGGGASGNYAMGVFDVSAVDIDFILNVTVGSGGTGATTYLGAATGGGTSSANATGINISASGGNGANQFYGGLLPLNGGLAASTSGNLLMQSMLINGENGQVTTQQTYQVAATTWHTAVHFGRGGHPPMGIGRGGAGSFRIHNASSAADGSSLTLYQGGFAGIAAGGGGGQALGSGWGWPGGRGYVIVRY